MAKKYRYYRFYVRIEKDLKKFELESVKNAIWNYLQDIGHGDIIATKMRQKPDLRFGGERFVRK